VRCSEYASFPAWNSGRPASISLIVLTLVVVEVLILVSQLHKAMRIDYILLRKLRIFVPELVEVAD
jgi:hypothetical protein